MSEKAFFNTYTELIKLSGPADPALLYGTEDYHKLTSLGPTLPKPPAGFPKAVPTGNDTQLVQVSFKSIKPPFKFSHSGEYASGKTVFHIKSDLIEAVPVLKDASVTPSNLKFLLKAKVLSDTTPLSTISDLALPLSVTVMVSSPTPATPAAATPEPQAAALDDEPEPEPQVSASTLAKIHELLERDVGPAKATVLVNRLKEAI